MSVRFALRIGTAAAASAAVALAASDGLCLFRACTGLACPGCGMTRAVGRLLSGDVAGSLALHPLLLPTVAVGIVWGTEALVTRRSARRPSAGPRLAVALAAVALVLWVVRAVTGTLP